MTLRVGEARPFPPLEACTPIVLGHAAPVEAGGGAEQDQRRRTGGVGLVPGEVHAGLGADDRAEPSGAVLEHCRVGRWCVSVLALTKMSFALHSGQLPVHRVRLRDREAVLERLGNTEDRSHPESLGFGDQFVDRRVIEGDRPIGMRRRVDRARQAELGEHRELTALPARLDHRLGVTVEIGP